MKRPILLVVACVAVLARAGAEPVLLSPPGPALPGTAALTIEGDIASELVSGVDRFLERKTQETSRERENRAGAGSINDASRRDLREQLAEMLGVVERRAAPAGFELVATATRSSLVATSALVRVHGVRWSAFGNVHGEGLLLEPVGREVIAGVVAVPDADLTPEQLAGLDQGSAGPFARRLAESGCRVVVPFLINRNKGEPKVEWDQGRGRNLSNREYLHRAAFEMGRTLAGYEVLKILSAVDVLAAEGAPQSIAVLGWGEGGRLALYAAALDARIKACGVSGYFGSRDGMWKEPLDRNVFGLLTRHGDAEIAALVAPRTLIIEAARAPEGDFPSDGSAPGKLATPALAEIEAEAARARALGGGSDWIRVVRSGDGTGPYGTYAWLSAILSSAKNGATIPSETAALKDLRSGSDARARADRQRRELDEHTQRLLLESPYARQVFMKDLDTSDPAKFAASQEKYREFFADKVIGRFADSRLPFNARSRLACEDPAWRGYEVVLDVFPDVIAYGLLLLPRDLEPGERRPVVVCQHGLEGRPQHTIGKEGFDAYSAFAARLAERGFITFAPQNLYIFRDRFRVLQRKANPLGKTLFSIITPQHQQIVDWLKTQDFVDPERIAFYGLSYGGKTAMRVPPLVKDYCLSICSADFNEWVWKNASTRSPYSYAFMGEYEIFEWNLGHTFNYAEMAALIAPRPFMVERGHFDGVAPDETVAYEFAKVRHLYAARLKLPPEACTIEWFVGPHKINGIGTYEFLHRHLKWPVR